MSRCIGLSIAVCIVGMAATASATEPTAAEYAIRWDTSAGGPASAEATLHALSLSSQDDSAYDVRYFSVAKPPHLPSDVSAILRERNKSKKTELTFKLRGPAPFSPTPTLANWACPVGAGAEKKDELDCSFLSGGDPKCVHSRSCTAESAGPPAIPEALHAQEKGCPAHVRRLKADSLKVEEWQLAGNKTVVEVSRNADDSKAARKKFRDEVVSVLLDNKVVPLEASKTELGGACQK